MPNSSVKTHPPGEDSSSPFRQLKKELHERLIASMDLVALRSMEPERLRRELRRGAEELCRAHSQLLNQEQREGLIEEILFETLGLGPLEPLMRDPTVSDILINGPDKVYVERRGCLEETRVRFHDLDHLICIVQRIAQRIGRRIDESSPMVDARLPDGSRVNAVIHPLALDGALVSIRRFSARPFRPGDMIARGSATAEMLDFLAGCVKARLNILIAGGTGSGKTTMLNMLSAYIPPDERIATIEDSAELQLQQPHVARMETRPPNLEGQGEVTARDLVRNALRMRPDRIIVGECRGKETLDMLQAMSTGHDGSLTTVHANDCRDALRRLEMLISMAAPELNMWFIQNQIANALNIVVHTARMRGGKRRITQISEITGAERESISMHDIFRFESVDVAENSDSQGYFMATGIQPECLGRLRSSGIHIPPALFQERKLFVDRLDSLS
ncbi:CpaF family protein [Lignipirellula cremea]|uniref:Conjugal transfer protein n=1 Tax=Lignipirellula cremea TaxID=2528010 RepID=A0A518DM84_9BACT|nr:CpaF family protein [Lignipirellula cremea]QDU92931.1 Putative conjugal transfer protein [Lignipirellula cremea]